MYADKQLVIRRTEEPGGLSFTGSIDLFNVESVARSLNTALGGEGDLHVDVSQLEFCDVSGIRAFVTAAENVESGAPSRAARAPTPAPNSHDSHGLDRPAGPGDRRVGDDTDGELGGAGASRGIPA